MPIGEKHKGLLTCKCGKNLVSVFAHHRVAPLGSGVVPKLTKIEGYAYCQDCNKIFRLNAEEL